MGTAEASFQALVEHMSRVETLHSVMGTLGWDEATMLPSKATALRGRQQALLASLAHDWLSDARIPNWLADIQGSDEPIHRACHRNLSRDYDRARNVPAELVTQLAEARSAAFSAWVDAKAASDWKRFEPHLEKLLSLSLRRAEAIDAHRHPYEVALESFDPGTTVEALRSMFQRLRDELSPLLRAIAAQPVIKPLDRAFDPDGQEALHRAVAVALGYDFERGRLDSSVHPFTSGHSTDDVRITTRIEAHNLLSGLGATIHETGHGLYEQGLPTNYPGTTLSQAASFGLHESQSRFWENYVGRSLSFATWLMGPLSTHLPGHDLTPDDLYRAFNRVSPGLIRVEADEVTYNLHVIVRFEIELALFEGRVRVSELPELWNARYQEYLGITPPDDARGVLQDVHWSGASFGYFPSYTLGNLYAASLGATLETQIPELWTEIEAGQFENILGFLRSSIHDQGHLFEAPDLMRQAAGERDHVEDLVSYLWNRHGKLYGVTRPTAPSSEL